MNRYRQVLRIAVLSAGVGVATLLPAHADAPGLDLNPLQFFSDCLGRVSALRVDRESHADTSGAAQAEAMRVVLAELVQTMTPPGGGPQVLTWRAEARAAQATLMTQAALNADRRAEELAQRLIARCAGMIVVPEPAAPADPA